MQSKSLIIKLAMVLGLLIALYIVVSIFVMPDLDRIVKLKEKYKTQKLLLGYARQNNEYLQNEIQKYKDLLGYLEPKDEIALQKSIHKVMGFEKFQSMGTVKKKRYTLRRYSVKAMIETPVKLYKLPEIWQKSSIPATLEYPIAFERKGNGIETSFIAGLYTFQAPPKESSK